MTIQLLGKELETGFLNGKKLEEVWYGGKKVRPMGWQPGPNTIAYYPLEVDANDYSGNNRNLIADAAISYNKQSGAFFPKSYHSGMLANYSITTNDKRTIQRRQKTLSIVKNDARGIDLFFSNDCRICNLWQNNEQSRLCKDGRIGHSTDYSDTWYNYTITIENGTVKIYRDGIFSFSGVAPLNKTTTYFRRGQEFDNAHNRQLNGYIKDIIIENKSRTDQGIADYYNQKKSDYGL